MSRNAMQIVLSIALMIPATGCKRSDGKNEVDHPDKKQVIQKSAETPLSAREEEESEWLVTVWILPPGERLVNYDALKSAAGNKQTLWAVIDEKTGTTHGLNLLTRARNLKIMMTKPGSISDASMKTIASCKNLRSVDFVFTDLTGAQLEILADCKNLKELYGVRAGTDGLASFKKARPDCKIDQSPRFP